MARLLAGVVWAQAKPPPLGRALHLAGDDPRQRKNPLAYETDGLVGRARVYAVTATVQSSKAKRSTHKKGESGIK